MRQRAHGLIIFFAFVLLLFSLQFLFYIVHQVGIAEKDAWVHLLVKERDAEGYGDWRDSLALADWQWMDLKAWGEKFSMQWESAGVDPITPAQLFSGKAAGVWVARLPDWTVESLLTGRGQLSRESLMKHPNTVNVLGFPRWEKELYQWGRVWSSICFFLIVLASAMLLSGVMAQLSLVMVEHRREMEIKHFLGATFPQLRGPLIRHVFARSLGLILGAVAINIVFYSLLVQQGVLQITLNWVHWFTAISAVAIVVGVFCVWLSARVTFRKLIYQWEL